jgi:hypothetical protein
VIKTYARVRAVNCMPIVDIKDVALNYRRLSPLEKETVTDTRKFVQSKQTHWEHLFVHRQRDSWQVVVNVNTRISKWSVSP